MRVYTSTDIIGVEWGGILKNIIAIIVGIAKGCLWGDSVQSAIITRGLTEMVRFGVSCGANADTLYGLSGLGDLVMTSTSELSRNHNFGYKVGTLGIFEAKRSSNDTIEGLNSLPFVLQLAKERGIDMPLSFTLAEVLAGEITPLQGLEELLSRPLKNE
jgi:glycerol-3-phosphate dehydrogenase (NAD(P)+)